jgi:hypothetical protein
MAGALAAVGFPATLLAAGRAVKQELLELVEGHTGLFGRLFYADAPFTVAAGGCCHRRPAGEAIAGRTPFGLRIVGHGSVPPLNWTIHCSGAQGE